MTAKKFSQLANRARNIAKNIGHRAGAGYLRNREIPFEQAYTILFNRAPTR